MKNLKWREYISITLNRQNDAQMEKKRGCPGLSVKKT